LIIRACRISRAFASILRSLLSRLFYALRQPNTRSTLSQLFQQLSAKVHWLQPMAPLLLGLNAMSSTRIADYDFDDIALGLIVCF